MVSTLLKRVAVITGVLAISAAPVLAASVWGPARPVLHYNGPGTPGADHVVFNSFDNSPNYGDERTFFDGSVSGANNTYDDTIQVTPGQVVTLRTYVHNNADSSLNASGKGIARNTKVSIELPTITGTSLVANSNISADNATPGTVYSSLNFQDSATPFGISYVPGSAVAYNNANPNGMAINDSIVNGGALIGYDKADGNLPGCYQYVTYVDIKVMVNAPSLSLTKQVTTPGSTNWQSSLNAKPGDTVSWLLTTKNTSSTVAKNVTIKDQLPAHLQVVPGSVTYISGSVPNGQVMSDSALFSANGQNLPDLTPGAVANVRYRTVVKNDYAADVCTDTAKNTAVVVGSGVNPIYASATVNVTASCKPVVQTVCAGITATPQGGLNSLAYAFGLTSTPAGNTNGSTFTISGDGSDTVNSATNSANYTFAKAGTYTVTGQLKTASGLTAVTTPCTVKLTVGTPTSTLPQTGPAGLMGGAAGLTGLGYATNAYLRSRKSLALSLRRK